LGGGRFSDAGEVGFLEFLENGFVHVFINSLTLLNFYYLSLKVILAIKQYDLKS
jgi:hypothetical protein